MFSSLNNLLFASLYLSYKSECQLACLCDNLLVLFQSVLEDLASHEVQLNRLKEKAQLLWDEHSAGKGFVHRVSQLSAQCLALTNLTKVK